MRAFRDGGVTDSGGTTVTEVGIDIPNATVMIVEHASARSWQLHQRRGRVGRGQAAGYCRWSITSTARGAKRLRVMEQQQDGFKIAEADLALRGRAIARHAAIWFG